jgi:hypothetical protein
MFRHYKSSFLGAAFVAALVACHPAVPAQSGGSAAAAAQCAETSAAPASAGREAREVVGTAPRSAARTPCLVGNPAQSPAAVPDGDDPIWRLDMP